MTTVTAVITSGTTWLVPSDWSSTNTVWCIGAGGNGGAGGASGGGGGACAFTSNIALVPGALVLVQIGTPGGTTGSGITPTSNTWFNTSALVAAGGQSGNAGGAAGSTANSAGGTKYAGGAGASYGGGSVNAGGGGAGGNTGAGAAGTNLGVGGQGDNGTGGAGGAAGTVGSPAGGNGAVGFEISSALGAGGGGGGGYSGGSGGGGGGLYGGGGGAGGGANNGGGQGVILISYTSTTDQGQDIWPTVTVDTPAFIAHKINPHLMADRGYDDVGALYYASQLISPVNTFIFDASGGDLPLKTVYVEAVAQRFNALYGVAYDDTGAKAYAAFITVAPTPKIRFDPAVTDILPLQGYVERQTQLFSLLRGQAYDDTGAHWYSAINTVSLVTKTQFASDGGLLPLGQYVELQGQRFALLRGQAYDDTGARHFAAAQITPVPLFQFSADGGMYPLARNNVGQRPTVMSLMFSQAEVPNQPIYYNLIIIPDVWFVECNELVSVLNKIITIVNSNLFALGISRSYWLPSFASISPTEFNNAINLVIEYFNNTIKYGLKLSSSYNIQLFLSVAPSQLTLAVNTLIGDINNVFAPYIGNYIQSGPAPSPSQSLLNFVIPPGHLLLVNGGNLLLV